MRIDRLNREILAIALPAIVSNITVPLLGLVDTGIAGHLGKAAYVGAIAVGGVIFSIIYWLFSFLRWGTSGLTSQSLGAGQDKEITCVLYRSCGLAMAIGLALILLQWPLFQVMIRLMDVTPEVRDFTARYFYICIWGAVPVQLLYALNGWCVGMQNSRIPMVVALVQNGVNIPLSLWLVWGLGMKIEGVALGTVVAQYLGLAVALLLMRRRYARYFCRVDWREVAKRSALMRFLSVNRDIMLRMVCLLAVTTWFTSAGARQGETILAANAILLQMVYFFSYFFDGFANAGEALCGKYYGARGSVHRVVRRVFLWGGILVVLFTAAYLVGEDLILGLMTSDAAVRMVAHDYFQWLLLVPVCGVMCFVWDGVFIGVTATRQLLLSMVAGTIVFFGSYLILFPMLGNHGLWVSFLLYFLARGICECCTARRAIER